MAQIGKFLQSTFKVHKVLCVTFSCLDHRQPLDMSPKFGTAHY